MLSARCQFALTIATAITVAYALALSWGWERPYWAGFAVAMIGLSTIGESVFKGLQRLAGTGVAVVVALVMISLFAQERWMFAISLSLWIAFCTWRMLANEENYYFWYCCAFIVPLVSVMSGFDSQTSFYIVETRAKQTLLGVTCFILVALLFTNRKAEQEFLNQVHKQLGMLRQRLDDVRDHATSLSRNQSEAERREELARGLMALPSLHASAKLESFEMSERANATKSIIELLKLLTETIDRLDLTLEFASKTPLPRKMPELLPALTEIDSRLGAAAELLREGKSERDVQSIAFNTPIESQDQSTFEKGEVLLRRDILAELDQQSAHLNAVIADLRDRRRAPNLSLEGVAPKTWLPDPELLGQVFLVFVTFWLAFLTYIYLPALPDGPVIVIISVTIGMNIARVPWTPAMALLVPAAAAVTAGTLVHILVMPHLSGFAGLGTLLFGSVFLINWMFYKPEAQAIRFITMALFLLMLQVSNENQAYSATYGMNVMVAVGILLLLVSLVQRYPYSWRPEDVLRRLIRRYGTSLLGVLEGMRWDDPATTGWYARQLRGYYLSQLHSLPLKIDSWITRLPEAVVDSDERKALRALTDRFQLLSFRMNDLARLRAHEADSVWIDLLSTEVKTWRLDIEQIVSKLLDHDETVELDSLHLRLDTKLASIERTIMQLAREGADTQAADEGTAHMQRVLAAYRGVSQAVIGIAERARQLPWVRIAETRF